MLDRTPGLLREQLRRVIRNGDVRSGGDQVDFEGIVRERPTVPGGHLGMSGYNLRMSLLLKRTYFEGNALVTPCM